MKKRLSVLLSIIIVLSICAPLQSVIASEIERKSVSLFSSRIAKLNEKYESEAHPFTIEVSHRPAEIDFEDEDVHDYRTNTLGKTDEELIDWDLSINGHTHGGQISLLFIGSIVSQNHGFFLGKVNVRGVHSQNGHIHYVCPRLGVSGPKFAWFCLLNTPAVGLITFKKSN